RAGARAGAADDLTERSGEPRQQRGVEAGGAGDGGRPVTGAGVEQAGGRGGGRIAVQAGAEPVREMPGGAEGEAAGASEGGGVVPARRRAIAAQLLASCRFPARWSQSSPS